ncbi:MAG: AAA family ATPase [Chitinophagaceae bacterium]|nr:MAG: AAA family ATPase [Chitinophagaceae bacterium]
MSLEMIDSLREALTVSPDNIPLRLHLAEVLAKERLYEDAAKEFSEILSRNYGHLKAKHGLADAYFHQKKYSAAIIVYEEIGEQLELSAMITYVRCLVREHSTEQALDHYQRILVMNPGFRDEELDAALRNPGVNPNDDDFGYEDDNLISDEQYFLEKPSIGFADVGGMKRVKDEISMKIIQPLKNPDLYKAFGKKIGGGILLYGPPGCGKTFIAKATAGEINAKFISIGLHDILDMWIGNSEKNLHEIFEVARRNTPCVLFFDEVDAIGASRSDLRQSAMRHVINQFLAELDGVNSNNDGILILAATNAPWSVDAAFRRPGRFDRIIFVEPPDESARIEIINAMLKDKPVGDIDVKKIAKEINEYSGADIRAMIDIAIEDKLGASLASGKLETINTKDLLKAAKTHKPSTLEWLSSARNYALYANESGLYDEILKYLKIKK